MAPNMNRQIVVLLGMAVCLAVCPVTAANVSNVHVEQRKRLGCKVHKVAFKDIAKRVFRVLPLRLVVKLTTN